MPLRHLGGVTPKGFLGRSARPDPGARPRALGRKEASFGSRGAEATAARCGDAAAFAPSLSGGSVAVV